MSLIRVKIGRQMYTNVNRFFLFLSIYTDFFGTQFLFYKLIHVTDRKNHQTFQTTYV